MATTIKIPVKLVAGHISAAAEIAAGKSLLPMLSNMLLSLMEVKSDSRQQT